MKKTGSLAKKRYKCDQNERRENVLRPNHYLGYDHDALGLHLLSRGAYEIAICCFRRAVWLNPFESAFKEHLALCLYKLRQYNEGLQLTSKRPDTKKDDKNTRNE